MIDFTLVALIWLIIIVGLLIVEGLTVNLVTIWFAFAAIPSFILSLLGINVIIQIVLFIILSIILLSTTKSFVDKLQKGKTIKTNYESIIDGKAIAIQDFGGLETGYVKINGMEWLAHSEDEISKDDTVIIKSVSGVKVKVKKA